VPGVFRRLALASVLFAAGCAKLPDYTPPPQRAALTGTDSGGLSYFLSMSNPNADAYIVEGIEAHTEGSGFRWAYAHPLLRFLVPRIDRPRFVMDFALPETTFRVTGPVTLSISLNGRPFDRPHFDHAGQQHYEHDVPLELLRANAINLVAIEPDKVYTAPADGVKLGFPLSRVGFVD
jgi:hypothetical protein